MPEINSMEELIEEEVKGLRNLFLTSSPDENNEKTRSTCFTWAKFTIEQKAEKIEYYLCSKNGMEDWLRTALSDIAEAARVAERKEIAEEIGSVHMFDYSQNLDGTPKRPEDHAQVAGFNQAIRHVLSLLEEKG